ncbi:twin-arginine translocation signal domain-containing protein [candidate division KSB1 bacterium]|nr:twin-arginine translocation signal domain-containing protein [candidate division KSB1 bacterium]
MPEKSNQSRRDFLKYAAGIAGLALASGGYVLTTSWKKDDVTGRLWRLNPAFTLKELSRQEIEISTTLGSGEKLRHRFTGLEADVFRYASQEKIIGSQIAILSKKHNLSEEQCRERICRSMEELAEAKLIYTGEKMLVKIVEVTNG